MKADLNASSVRVFRLGLSSLAVVLRRAAVHAETYGLALPDLLQARLYPDMYPLYRRAQIICDFAGQAPDGTAGLEVPNLEGAPEFAEVQSEIIRTKEFLDGLSPAQYLLGFAVQNFLFHLVTAYAILRMSGVALGKRDYFGFPPRN